MGTVARHGRLPHPRWHDPPRQNPGVVLEVISPSGLRHKRLWDLKRASLQAVRDVPEIVEILPSRPTGYSRRASCRGCESISTACLSACPVREENENDTARRRRISL